MIDIIKRISNNDIMNEDSAPKAGVLVPFYNDGENLRLLLEKRSPHIRQGSEISFPGGLFDYKKDHSLQDTAIRETQEEIGIHENKVEIIGSLGTMITVHGMVLKAYTGLLNICSLRELNPTRDEVDYLIDPPLDFFLDNQPENYEVYTTIHPYDPDKGKDKLTFPAQALNLPSRYHRSWKGTSQKVYLYTYKEEKIWGITAWIIKRLIEKIKKQITF